MQIGTRVGDAEVIMVRKDGDFDDWIRIRRSGLGGTDAAALVGANPYKSVTSLFFEKMADKDEPVSMTPGSEAAYWGRTLEPLVAQEFTRRSGIPVRPADVVLRSVKWPWMLATPDYFGYEPADDPIHPFTLSTFLECKTTAWYLGRHWKAGSLPPYVDAQVSHYLAVMGFDHAWAAVLIGGQNFVHLRVDRNERALQALAETEARFWEYVEAGTMPPDPFPVDADAVKPTFAPNETMQVVILPPWAKEAIEAYYEYAEICSTLQEKRELLERQLGDLLYGARVGLLDGEPVIEWKGARTTRQLVVRRPVGA